MGTRSRERIDDAASIGDWKLQLDRIVDIWHACRTRNADRGPWLYGEISIADVMYAPVALRFVTYDIEIPVRAREFMDAVTNHPAIQEWQALAAAETETLDFVDNLIPIEQTPLTQG